MEALNAWFSMSAVSQAVAATPAALPSLPLPSCLHGLGWCLPALEEPVQASSQEEEKKKIIMGLVL